MDDIPPRIARGEISTRTLLLCVMSSDALGFISIVVCGLCATANGLLTNEGTCSTCNQPCHRKLTTASKWVGKWSCGHPDSKNQPCLHKVFPTPTNAYQHSFKCDRIDRDQRLYSKLKTQLLVMAKNLWRHLEHMIVPNTANQSDYPSIQKDFYRLFLKVVKKTAADILGGTYPNAQGIINALSTISPDHQAAIRTEFSLDAASLAKFSLKNLGQPDLLMLLFPDDLARPIVSVRSARNRRRNPRTTLLNLNQTASGLMYLHEVAEILKDPMLDMRALFARVVASRLESQDALRRLARISSDSLDLLPMILNFLINSPPLLTDANASYTDNFNPNYTPVLANKPLPYQISSTPDGHHPSPVISPGNQTILLNSAKNGFPLSPSTFKDDATRTRDLEDPRQRLRQELDHPRPYTVPDDDSLLHELWYAASRRLNPQAENISPGNASDTDHDNNSSVWSKSTLPV